jgi:hypothetical protein
MRNLLLFTFFLYDGRTEPRLRKEQYGEFGCFTGGFQYGPAGRLGFQQGNGNSHRC